MFLFKAATVISALSSILAEDGVPCQYRTVVTPHNTEYRRLCEKEPHWPCFVHTQMGELFKKSVDANLHHVTVSHNATSSDKGGVGGVPLLLAKDGDLIDFTPKDPSKPFVIDYLEYGVALTYANRFKVGDQWCFTVGVQREMMSDYDIRVTGEGKDPFEIKTEDFTLISKGIICTKWARITIYTDR